LKLGEEVEIFLIRGLGGLALKELEFDVFAKIFQRLKMLIIFAKFKAFDSPSKTWVIVLEG
jgi:hypothetical protein